MPESSYQDGLQSLAALTASCLNNGLSYICFGFTPSVDAMVKEFVNQSGEPLGSDTRTGHTKGSLALQYELAADAIDNTRQAKPGYAYLFQSSYYIGGKLDPALGSHDVVKFNQAAIKCVNPIISTLLSTIGQRKDVTVDSAAGAYALTCAAVNTRSGATLTWSLENAPSGMTINASTGVIAWTTPVDGTYAITVKVKDVVSGETDRYGAGFLKLTVT